MYFLKKYIHFKPPQSTHGNFLRELHSEASNWLFSFFANDMKNGKFILQQAREKSWPTWQVFTCSKSTFLAADFG